MIHVNRGATSLGAFPEEQVREGIRAGRFLPSDLGWKEGIPNWQPLSQFPEFAEEIGAVAKPSAVSSSPAQPVASLTAANVIGRSEPLSIISLVLSLLGLPGFLCCAFIIFSIPGIVCGHLALSNIGRQPGAQGRGMALAGLIIGYASLFIWIAYVIFFGGITAIQQILNSMNH